MNTRKLAMMVTVASALSLGAAELAHASGRAFAIRSCTYAEAKWGNPQAHQAFIFSFQSFYAEQPCWVLEYDSSFQINPNRWAGYDVSEGFPNDTISSVKTGSDVYLILFWHSFGTHSEGGTLDIGSSTAVYTLGSWNSEASAARLVYGRVAPGQIMVSHGCSTTEPNRIVLWDTAGFVEDDCTVLDVAAHQYPNPVSMAYRNDNLSAVMTNAVVRWVNFYKNSNYDGYLFQMTGTDSRASLRESGQVIIGMNNSMSSIRRE